MVRPVVAGHLADILAASPVGVIDVSGLPRTGHLDALRAFHRGLAWPATHAAVRALASGMPVLTVDPERYAGTGIDVLTL